MDELYRLLMELGITSRYTGYCYVVDAVSICMSSPDSISWVTKEVYPVLARRYRVSTACVEQNIRFIVEMIWEKRRSQMELIAGTELEKRPTNKQFLTLMASYLKKDANGDDSF